MATAEHPVPPLVPGERLTRKEFLRRWDAYPEIKKAELIGGIVYMPSPVGVEHGEQDNDVGFWLGYYEAFTPGTKAGTNTTTMMVDDSPQPDDYLRLLPEAGGRTWIEGKYLHGSPELIAEVCRTSAAYDLHPKLELYQQAGVPEYLAVLLEDREIRWHRLVDGTYQVMPAGADGIWRSPIFPGLWLDGAALLGGNKAQILTVLNQGLQTPEHARFVADLGRKMRAPG